MNSPTPFGPSVRTARGNARTTGCAMVLASSLLGACATTLTTPDQDATSSAAITATPDAAPQRTITNFTESLRCMDEKLQQYEISGILLGAQEVTDLASEVTGTKDMLMTSLSTMSRKSKAFSIVTLSQDLGDVTAFHKLHGTQSFQSPDFFIRLSSPQIDKGIQVAQVGGGLRVPGAVNAEASRDRIASVVSMDMNLGMVRNLQLLPGIYSSNSIAVVRKGSAFDVAGEIQKMGALFRISNDNSEGFHHSVRTLVELGAIELVGRLTQIPYWECLDIESTNPAVQKQVQDWYAGFDDTERLLFVQGKLSALGVYDGPVDGKDGPEVHTAIATWKADKGLIADGEVDFLLYYNLVIDPTPVAPEHLELLKAQARGDRPLFARLDRLFSGEVPEDGGSLPDDGGRTLTMSMRTDRGRDPVVYRQGESINLSITLDNDAHVYCYYQQGNGAVLKLFPNRFRPYSRLAAGQTLELPGDDPFQIKADRAGENEQLMCLASYDDIDPKLPFPLREKDLQPIPVDDLDRVNDFYRGVAETMPLRQTIDVEVVQ